MLIMSFVIATFIAYMYSNYYPLIILTLSAISITIYDFISKKIPAMDIFVAFGIFLLIIYGAITVSSKLNNLAFITIILGTLQVFFMQFIAGGLKDAEHDYKGKAQTLAIRIGVRVQKKKMFIPLFFKILAYSLQALFLLFLFYPFLPLINLKGIICISQYLQF